MFTALVLLTGFGATGCATALTGDPARVDHDAVIVSGQVVADTAGTVEYWAEYGLTDAYGSESQHLTIAVQKNAPAAVGVQLTGLARSTPYHYRLCARDSSQKGGPGCGEDRSVRTQSVACGETVTTDVRLTGDLDCRGAPVLSPGLAVGADGIDINLGGFRVLGPVNSGGGGAPGIDNGGGFDDVTIRNGGVAGFGDGVRLVEASYNRVLRLDAVGAQDGIDIKGGEANAVRRSSATGRIGGIVVSRSNVAIVANNSATGNFDDGLSFDGVDDGRIVGNTATGGGSCCVTRAIVVAGNRNVIRDNHAKGRDGGSLVLLSGADNALIGNEAFGGVLSGMAGGADYEGDGIFVGAFTSGTLLRGNVAHDNAGDGMEVRGAASRLGDNLANDNGDWGIDAVAGVLDLGGNSASGNGQPAQCRNLFCG